MKLIKLSTTLILSNFIFGSYGYSQDHSIGEIANKAVQYSENKTKISNESVAPGTHVFMGGKKVQLHKGSIKLGDNFSKYAKELGIKLNGVAIVNIVPSIDTPVCEEQSHILGESTKLNKGVQKIVISRDTPMAQKRFAKEAKLENISYGSDFKLEPKLTPSYGRGHQ